MRPANIVTAIADVLAGVAISAYFLQYTNEIYNLVPVVILCFSTVGLYGGGVVFNDVFDANLDKTERPERPIPSGLITKAEAIFLGLSLLCTGIILAFFVNSTAGFLSLSITASALAYDKWGKHLSLLGPINMGLCRGLNLLLGVSIIPSSIHSTWFVALVPIIYIASITMISRGEVHGGSKSTLYSASILYMVVLMSIFYLSVLNGNLLYTFLFLIPFTWMIFKPLLTAIKEPIGKNIGRAVKAGVIALILMNAAWAAAFGALYLALIIVILLPVSIKLGRIFAVT